MQKPLRNRHTLHFIYIDLDLNIDQAALDILPILYIYKL